MKICYLNHDTRENTGAGRFYNALISALRKTSPDVEAEVMTSEDVLRPGVFRLLLNLGKIRAILAKSDLIHALDGWPYGFIAALASLGLGKKLIITAVGTGGVQALYHPWKKYMLSWAYRRADRLVAVSRHTRDEILKVLPDLKIEVINHGVDSDLFQLPVADPQLPLAKPYILSVGAWKKRKGLEYSIAAFDLLKDRFPGLHYVILSSPPQEIRKKYGQVNFVSGFSEEALVALYKNAELFILLPQDDHKDIEGFGLAYLEAAAAGLPVIGAKNTSAEDAVLDGKNGFLVDGKNTQEAAAKMSVILNDPALRSKMAAESKNFAQKMTWEKAANSYRKIYFAATQ